MCLLVFSASAVAHIVQSRLPGAILEPAANESVIVNSIMNSTDERSFGCFLDGAGLHTTKQIYVHTAGWGNVLFACSYQCCSVIFAKASVVPTIKLLEENMSLLVCTTIENYCEW